MRVRLCVLHIFIRFFIFGTFHSLLNGLSISPNSLQTFFAAASGAFIKTAHYTCPHTTIAMHSDNNNRNIVSNTKHYIKRHYINMWRGRGAMTGVCSSVRVSLCIAPRNSFLGSNWNWLA